MVKVLVVISKDGCITEVCSNEPDLDFDFIDFSAQCVPEEITEAREKKYDERRKDYPYINYEW